MPTPASPRTSVGAKTAILLPIGIGLATIGLFLLAGGTAMLFFGLRHQTAEPILTPSENPALPTPGSHPARLNGHLDPQLSRWQWLVKWLLIIPHVIVLTVLWIAVAMLDNRRRRRHRVHGSVPALDLRLQRWRDALDMARVVLRAQRPGHRPLSAIHVAVRPHLSGRLHG